MSNSTRTSPPGSRPSVCELAEKMTELSETPGGANGSVKQASGPGLEHLMWPCSLMSSLRPSLRAAWK